MVDVRRLCHTGAVRKSFFSDVENLRHPSARLPRETASSSYRVLDLFAGAGGISEGFRQAGFTILGGLDSDPDASATYALNFPQSRTISGDIRSPRVRDELGEILPGVDVIVGGPPCQAFSQMRNHTRVIDDPRNSLYREFVAALRVAKPRAFLMENVTGIDQLRVRDQIALDLTIEGEYQVVTQVVDAANFGVPQTRKRLLFIGLHRDLGVAPPFLKGTNVTRSIALQRSIGRSGSTYSVVMQDDLFARQLGRALCDPGDDSVVTAYDAISDLAFLPPGNRDDELPCSELAPPSSSYQRKMRAGCGDILSNVQIPRINRDTAIRLMGIPDGGNHRDLSDDLRERYITGQRWGRENGSGRLSRRHFYAYRRLHPAIWAWTLNTKADSVYHYEHPRSLSVREFARFQSFPDRFVFATDPRRGPIPGRHDGGPAHSRYRQVGNAVPPLLAKAVADRLLELLEVSRERSSLPATFA